MTTNIPSKLLLLAMAALLPMSLAAPSMSQATVDEVAIDGAVNVDFKQSRGQRFRAERVSNVSRLHTFAQQRDADVAFYNEVGLHGDIYRVWVDSHKIRDPENPDAGYNYASIVDYLSDISRLSDSLLVVMDTRVEVRDFGYTPEQIKPIVKRILSDLKLRFPQIKYIEAFNEPDHNMYSVVKPETLYGYYEPYYQAINEINEEMKPLVPLQVGGPSLTTYKDAWMDAFLDGYAADTSPEKRLDFISWHAYGKFTQGGPHTEGPRAYHFYKGDPSEVADQRAQLEAALSSRGIPENIPGFITETGIYPGPSFDHRNDPHADYVIQAAGVQSLLYWYMEQEHMVPFNWVLRHKSEERKDQLITRVADAPIPTRVLSPYGNSVLMMSMLKDERVAAESSTLVEGRGVYAIASKDEDGVAVMLWNYQSTDNTELSIRLDLQNLPAAVTGKSVHQRHYRIDAETSNYWANPKKADLQLVEEAAVITGSGYSMTVNFAANALHLIILEPSE